jgi:hypothetical protein
MLWRVTGPTDAETRVQAIVDRVTAVAAQGRVDDGLADAAVAELGAVPIVSEYDRALARIGFVAVADALIPAVGEATAGALTDLRQKVQTALDERFRPGSLVVRAEEVVDTLLQRLVDGEGPPEELASAAMAEVAALPQDASDADLLTVTSATLRIAGVGGAVVWLKEGGLDEPADKPVLEVVRITGRALAAGGFDRERLLAAAAAVDAIPEENVVVIGALQLLVGLGLAFRTDASPAVEPIVDRLTSRMMGLRPTESGPPAALARRDDILRGLVATLLREGFSLYALSSAQVALGRLDDGDVVVSGLGRVVDITAPFARRSSPRCSPSCAAC